MNAPARTKVAVLISGRGSNMEALLHATHAPDFPGRIVLVASNRPEAAGLETARRQGVAVAAVDQRLFTGRAAHEAAVAAAIVASGAEIVCLAGYMRILSPSFVSRFAGRMINIHPSLLPLFPGLDTHRRAIEAGVRIHGCTVHFVTETMDEGPIIAQAAVPVEALDDADTLSARVLTAEHRLYAHALRLVVEGRVRMEGGQAVWDSSGTTSPADVLIAPPLR